MKVADNRMRLLVVAILFLSPFIVALVLNRLGWHPHATRNHGELIQPPQALAGQVLVDRAGDALPLVNPDHRWTWLIQLPEQCGQVCVERLDELHRVRYSLGRHAPKLVPRLIAPAQLPELPPSMTALSAESAGALLAAAPQLADAPAWSGYLIDDKGYLMMRFPPELEARLVRRDLGRLVK